MYNKVETDMNFVGREKKIEEFQTVISKLKKQET